MLKATAAALVLLALLTALGLQLADTQAKSRGDIEERVRERGTLATALIDGLFESTLQQAAVHRRNYGGTTVSTKTLEANRRQSPYLLVLDPSGKILGESRGVTPAVRADLKRSPSIRAALAGRPYGIGDVVPYARTGVIAFAVPFDTPSGRRLHVSGFTPQTLGALIDPQLRKIPGVDGSRNYLLDGRYTVLASTNPERPPGYVYRGAEQTAALAQRSGTFGDRYYQQVRVAQSGWNIVLAAPEEGLFAAVSGARKWVPWALFLAFALAALAAFVLARRALAAGDRVRSTNAELARVNAALGESNSSLNRRAAELARSNDELEQFASIASHDLQEPLRKVRTFTQQVTVIDGERLSDKGRDYLERSNAAAERMQRLIEDLLRFSRVTTQVRPFARVALDDVVRDVLVDLELEVERAGATVHVGELPEVSGDVSQLRQLVHNLLATALMFRRDDVAPEVRVDATVEAGVARVRVSDNGIGFDAQYEQRIFRVFERLHGRGKYPGTGIGLALCRKIAERHGGTVTALGEPGAGSTFTIVLPVDQQEEVVVFTSDPVGSSHEDAPAYA